MGTEELYLGVGGTLYQYGDRNTMCGGWKNSVPIRGEKYRFQETEVRQHGNSHQ